jgi:hypothetical protein
VKKTTAARDIQIGDIVDLECDPFADPKGEHVQFECEYQTVCSVEHESPECVAIGFEGFDIVAFPPDHRLITCPCDRQAVAENH